MKVYLDACALNRLTDDQSQRRIHEEAEAVEAVFKMIWKQQVDWSASTALVAEAKRNPDLAKRHDSIALLSHAHSVDSPRASTILRSQQLRGLGYGTFDALHLACAEQAAVDVVLTTDDRLIRRAARNPVNPVIPVLNPVDWLREDRVWRLRNE